MAEPMASIQQIVFGERNHSDIAGVLRDMATAGFPALEAGNMFASYGEENSRRLLAENNLRVSGAHFGYGEYADAERLGQHIAYAKAMGVQHLMCSGVADIGSIEGYKQSAKLFDAVGKRLADEGLIFNYHNHAWEFDDLGGVNGMEILAAETDPALVKFNIDVFWVHYAGKDPVEYIAQHADRAGYFHFKDGRRHTNADGEAYAEYLELGRGDVDLKAAFDAACKVGAQWIVAEQDTSTLPAVEAATISRTFMKEKLGI